jgi:tryptophanyl-tRNA synthetase
MSKYTIKELEEKYEGCGYGDFKKDLVEVVIEGLKPIKERYQEIRDSEELPKILEDGAERANAISVKTLERVKTNVGLGIK